MTHWFTADPHFGHANIIRFCNRPFPNVEAMNAHLLAQYRAVVRPGDDLWILGDFAVGKADEARRAAVRAIFDAIPGRKHLVLGNHDRPWIRGLPWDSLTQMADIPVDGRRLVLCHYPMITWPGARRGALQLFGHVHGNWRGTRNSINVGLDVWEFRPVTLPEIEARAATLPVNKHWDEVEPGCAFPTVLCAWCHAILDPQTVSGHAMVRGDRLVVAQDDATIARIGVRLPRDLTEGDHLCPECIGGHLSLGHLILPPGHRYVERLNRSIPGDQEV